MRGKIRIPLHCLFERPERPPTVGVHGSAIQNLRSIRASRKEPIGPYFFGPQSLQAGLAVVALKPRITAFSMPLVAAASNTRINV